MTTAIKTKDNFRATYRVRENSQQAWRLIKSEEQEYYLYMKWQVQVIMTDLATQKQVVHTISRGRDVSSPKTPKYDRKIGGFGYNLNGTYTIVYGKAMGSRNKKTIAVKGADLECILRSLVANGNKGILVDNVPIRPVVLGIPTSKHQARQVASGVPNAIDPIVNNETKTDDQILTATHFTISHRIDRDWTWFTITYRGRQLTNYADVALLIPAWGKLLREEFGKGPDYSEKKGAFFVKKAIAAADLQAFFQLHAPALTDTQKEQAIVKTDAKFNGQPGGVIRVVVSSPHSEAEVTPSHTSKIIDVQEKEVKQWPEQEKGNYLNQINPSTVVYDEDRCVIGFAHPTTKSSLQSAKPTQSEKSQRLPKQGKERGLKAPKSVNNKEAYQQDIHEARDGSKYIGYLRRENGRFGSFSLHDGYGDEDDAD